HHGFWTPQVWALRSSINPRMTSLAIISGYRFGPMQSSGTLHLAPQGLQGQLNRGLPWQLVNNLIDVQGDLDAR
ncbi:MAG: hypothetical protein RIS44_2079, partial [Pseudomonadota bacterium]